MKVVITKDTFDLVRRRAILPFNEKSVLQLDDGTFQFEISDIIFEQVNDLAFAGESFSDTVFRILSTRQVQIKRT